MSWDVILFNSKQKIDNITELDESQLEPIYFSKILESAFDRIKKNDNHREIIGTDFTIDFFVEDVPSSNFMLQLYGEKGLYELVFIHIFFVKAEFLALVHELRKD